MSVFSTCWLELDVFIRFYFTVILFLLFGSLFSIQIGCIVNQFYLFGGEQAKLGPYLPTFFRLRKMQNRFHGLFTLVLLRTVKRSRPMIRQMWANGNSTFPMSGSVAMNRGDQYPTVLEIWLVR